MTDQELINQLHQLTEGLQWMSESEYPIEVFFWEQPDDSFSLQSLLRSLGYAPNTPVETESVESFFTPAAQEQDWQNEAERSEVKRYRELQDWLRSHLHDPQVYRIGKTEIDVYVLGTTSEGNVAGVKTQVVET